MDVRDPQTYQIIGAAIEVHRILGTGFLKAVYPKALAAEFAERAIPTLRECPLDIEYKGCVLKCQHRADFVCFSRVIVEVKAKQHLTANHDAQALNDLKATGFDRAPLVNFGQTRLQHRRLVRSADRYTSSSASICG